MGKERGDMREERERERGEREGMIMMRDILA